MEEQKLDLKSLDNLFAYLMQNCIHILVTSDTKRCVNCNKVIEKPYGRAEFE